jgi:hypothetical protein
VDDEAEVGLVEAHAERGGGHEGLDLVALERLLGRLALGRVRPARVGQHRVAGLREQGRRILGRRDRQAVDDAAAGQGVEVLGQPGEPARRRAEVEDAQPQRVARQRAPEREDLVAARGHLLGHVGDHALVGRRRGRQHRHGRR